MHAIICTKLHCVLTLTLFTGKKFEQLNTTVTMCFIILLRLGCFALYDI